MKRVILLAILASAVAGLSPQVAQAQGTIYVSSLGLTSTGSASVRSDSWLAQGFRAGTNAGGYLLNVVELALADALRNPTGFTAMIYDVSGLPAGAVPGSSLGTLNGSLDPVAGGIYTYSPATNLTLLPRTSYYIVLTAGTPVANGAYEWSVTSTQGPAVSGGWSADNFILSSSDGLHWRGFAGGVSLFSISATDVPEPSTLGLPALGGCFLLWRRRKVKGVNATFFTSPRTGPPPSAVSGLP